MFTPIVLNLALKNNEREVVFSGACDIFNLDTLKRFEFKGSK